MRSTTFKITTCFFLLIILVACSGQKGDLEAGIQTTKQEDSDGTIRATYIERIDKKHIVLLTNVGERVFTVTENTEDFFEKVKKDEIVEITFYKNEYNENFIEEASYPENKARGSKKEKNDKSITLEIDGELVEAKEEKSSLGYTIFVLEDYQLQKESNEFDLLVKKDSSSFVTIEILDKDSEIRRLRWHAAGELEHVGDLIELKADEIEYPYFRDSEFVFTASNGEFSETFVIQEINQTLYRFVFRFDKSIDDVEKLSLWKMIETIQ